MKLSKWLKKHPNVGRVIIAVIAIIMVLSLMIPAAALAEPTTSSSTSSNGAATTDTLSNDDVVTTTAEGVEDTNLVYDETPSITVVGITNNTDKYVAYQLFAGVATTKDTSSANKTELSDIVFGDGVNDKIIADMKQFLGISRSDFTANDALVTIDAYNGPAMTQVCDKLAKSFVANNPLGGYTFENKGNGTAYLDLQGAGLTEGNVDVGCGWWVISQQSESGTVLGATLVRVMDDARVSIENPEPIVTKSIISETSGDHVGYTDAAGGEAVKFNLRVNISSDADKYEGDYKMLISDELSDGLIFDTASKDPSKFQVKVGDYDVPATKTNTDGTSSKMWTVDFRDNTFTLSFVNSAYLKQNAGKEVTLVYTATVDAANMQGGPDLYWATSTAKCEYTSDKKDSAKTSVVTQQTTTTVYTCATYGNVVTPDGEPLGGNAFKMASRDGWLKFAQTDTPGKYAVIGHVDSPDDGDEFWTDDEGHFEIIGLDFEEDNSKGGAYQFWQTQAPDGYVPAEEYLIVKLTADIGNPNSEKAYVELVGEGTSDGVFEYANGNQILIIDSKYVDPNAIQPGQIITALIVILIGVGGFFGVKKFLAWRRDQYDYDDYDDEDEFEEWTEDDD